MRGTSGDVYRRLPGGHRCGSANAAASARPLRLPPARLAWMAFMELGVSRRVVEIPRTEISQERRSALLRSQGAYLRSIYDSLVAQLGEAAALAEFERQISVS